MTLKFNRVSEVVEVFVRATFHQAECSGSWVIAATHFFALSRNGKESQNPVLKPWPLIYDIEFLWVSSGCRSTCSCKIS